MRMKFELLSGTHIRSFLSLTENQKVKSIKN